MVTAVCGFLAASSFSPSLSQASCRVQHKQNFFSSDLKQVQRIIENPRRQTECLGIARHYVRDAIPSSSLSDSAPSLLTICRELVTCIQGMAAALPYCIPLYLIHVTYLSQVALDVPSMLSSVIPTPTVNLDTIVGLFCLIFALFWRASPNIGDVWGPVVERKDSNWSGMIRSIMCLVFIQNAAGYISSLVGYFCCIAALLGLPITLTGNQSVQVLVGNIAWLVLGCWVLEKLHGPFLSPKGKWYRPGYDIHPARLASFAIIGYYASLAIYNISDALNTQIAPFLLSLTRLVRGGSGFHNVETGHAIIADMIESIRYDPVSVVVGAIAPCVTAAFWEEVLYRGFFASRLLLPWYTVVGAVFCCCFLPPPSQCPKPVPPLCARNVLGYCLSSN
eukprot:Rmarinus@m.1720